MSEPRGTRRRGLRALAAPGSGVLLARGGRAETSRDRWKSIPLEERERLLRNYRRWEELTIRRNFARIRDMDPEESQPGCAGGCCAEGWSAGP